MATTHRVIVAGSRTIVDYAFFRRQFIKYLKSLPPGEVEVITGRAPHGPDDMAYHFCKWDSYEPKPKLKEMPADWDEHGKRAGYLRNADMASYASKGHNGGRLFSMHDGESKGTLHMNKLARDEELKLKLFVVDPPDEPISEILNYRL